LNALIAQPPNQAAFKRRACKVFKKFMNLAAINKDTKLHSVEDVKLSNKTDTEDLPGDATLFPPRL
jgi:hypothetical protein